MWFILSSFKLNLNDVSKLFTGLLMPARPTDFSIVTIRTGSRAAGHVRRRRRPREEVLHELWEIFTVAMKSAFKYSHNEVECLIRTVESPEVT